MCLFKSVVNYVHHSFQVTLNVLYYSQNEATRTFNIKSSNIYFLKRLHKIYVCCVPIHEVLSCFP